jgi:hypothetical protein
MLRQGTGQSPDPSMSGTPFLTCLNRTLYRPGFERVTSMPTCPCEKNIHTNMTCQGTSTDRNMRVVLVFIHHACYGHSIEVQLRAKHFQHCPSRKVPSEQVMKQNAQASAPCQRFITGEIRGAEKGHPQHHALLGPVYRPNPESGIAAQVVKQ